MRRREKSVGYHFARMERASKTNKLFEVAERVIKGEYGNGLYRIRMLEMDGYDSAKVQNIVNVMFMERKNGPR